MVTVATFLMALVISLIQKIIRVPNTEIGSLLITNNLGVKNEDEDKALKKFKDYKASFKFRRFKITFAWKILFWNISAMLFFIVFFRKVIAYNSSERKCMFLT